MIEFDRFRLAAPPFTDLPTIAAACRTCGLIQSREQATSIYGPFSEPSHDMLRIGFVRDPFDWLCDCFLYFLKPKREKIEVIEPFSELPIDLSMEGFIRAYVKHSDLSVSELFDTYEADSFFRSEEFPRALSDMLKPFNIPDQWIMDAKNLFDDQSSDFEMKVPPILRQAVYQKDILHCERFDYF